MSARLLAKPGTADPQATRVVGLLLLAGATLAAITVALPPAAHGSEVAVLAIGAAAAIVGTTMLLTRPILTAPALGAIAALSTILVTVATDEGGGASGAADNEILYVWICLYSFYFLGLGHALAQLTLIGLAYAWLLGAADVGLGEASTRWIVTVGTLLVAGLVIASLRESLQRLIGELTDRVRLDGLTGLLNRHGLEERAVIEFARSRRGAGPVAILIADIDSFKAINDSLGHPAGDQVLRRIASVLSQETRPIDVVARLGGDEFVVLLPGTAAEDAHEIADRLRVAVRRSAGDARLRLSLSIGVAIAPADGKTLDELAASADRAMYEAKRSGGDALAAASAASRSDSRPAASLVEP